MPDILASLRSADFDRLEDELQALEQAGIDALHLDVMDGVFCDEVSLPLQEVERVRGLTSLPLDVHLMVDDPAAVVGDWIAAGVQRISFHLEACDDPAPVLDEIRAAGLTAGLVILPETAVEQLYPWLARIGLVNPLGVNPVAKTGYDDRTPARIAALAQRRKAENLDFLIQADGGVWEKTRAELVQSGADELVGGYPIFSNNDYKVAIRELRGGG
ncbi:ribulose-phosphate 3-epimerase [bacterium]|nr:MAG: ribulose-phosphate 3-epimerase [bacterium]